VLGDLLSPQMHERAFLATKVWTRGERSGIEQMTHSAQQLKTQRLDLIQVHNLLDLETQLKTLRAWKDAGRVRYLGVTHYTVGAHTELARLLERESSISCSSTTPLTRDAESACCASRVARRGGADQPPVRGRRAL
jgi:diketogulonate reductase-like aldo/keto reductase